jgi:hypothetical protein
VGALRFGMSRKDVHVRLGEPDEEGGWPDAGEVEDEWETDGIAVVFDADGACVEIALFPPASVTISGVRMMGEADGDARAALVELDPDCGDEDGVLVSQTLGLVYAEDDEGDPELLVIAPGRLDALAAVDDDGDADADADDGDGDDHEADA